MVYRLGTRIQERILKQKLQNFEAVSINDPSKLVNVLGKEVGDVHGIQIFSQISFISPACKKYRILSTNIQLLVSLPV